jgi:hypothetical protein
VKQLNCVMAGVFGIVGASCAGGTSQDVLAPSPAVIETAPISPPAIVAPTDLRVGQPGYFRFGGFAGTGGPLIVAWADGTSIILGAIYEQAVLAHIYNAPGIYTVTVTRTNADGSTQTASVVVTVT